MLSPRILKPPFKESLNIQISTATPPDAIGILNGAEEQELQKKPILTEFFYLSRNEIQGWRKTKNRVKIF